MSSSVISRSFFSRSARDISGEKLGFFIAFFFALIGFSGCVGRDDVRFVGEGSVVANFGFLILECDRILFRWLSP